MKRRQTGEILYLNSVEKMSSQMRNAVEAQKFKTFLGLNSVDDPKWFKVESKVSSKAAQERLRKLKV